MNPFNQFWKKYIDDDSADISIVKRKQEISRWLLIYALVVLALRGIEFIVFGHVLLFFGEDLIVQSFGSGFITLFFIYSLPLLMWVYSIRASRPEELLIWYLFFDKIGLFFSFSSSFFYGGFRGIVISVSFLLANLLITKKLKRLLKRRLIEKSTSTAEAKSESTKRDLLRTEANAMLFAYGIAALYPRLMGSFMRVGIWDFVFSGMPRSWWNIALYSSIPFVVCLYSIKTKKTDKLVLGYSAWLTLDTMIALVLSILGFLGAALSGVSFPTVKGLDLKGVEVLFNCFFAVFADHMYMKYVESVRGEERGSRAVKNVLISLSMIPLVILVDDTPFALLIPIVIGLIYLIIGPLWEVISHFFGYFWGIEGSVSTRKIDVGTTMILFVILTHLIYALEALSWVLFRT